MNVINHGAPTMAENYQIARLMIALREAGLEIRKIKNLPDNAGISPYLALVRSLNMHDGDAEKVVQLKRMAWMMAKEAGPIEVQLDTMQKFNPERAVLTQRINPTTKSVIISAEELPEQPGR